MNDYDVIDRGPGDNQNPMTFCDADACCSCALAEGDPDCLRRKGIFVFGWRLGFLGPVSVLPLRSSVLI